MSRPDGLADPWSPRTRRLTSLPAGLTQSSAVRSGGRTRFVVRAQPETAFLRLALKAATAAASRSGT